MTTTTTADAPVVAPAPRCLVVVLRAKGGGSWWWMRWINGQWVDDLLPGQAYASAWVHESDIPRDASYVLYVPHDGLSVAHETAVAARMADHRDAVRAWTGRTPAIDVSNDVTDGWRKHRNPELWHPASNPKRLVRWPRAGWR